MFKTLFSMLLAAMLATGLSAAHAHGEAKPKHGGVVQSAGDLSFELVPLADGAAIYIEDHGQPLAPAGAGGKLTVLNGAEKSQAELKPAGDKLEARGIKLTSAAKVVALVTTAQKKTITVRFTIK